MPWILASVQLAQQLRFESYWVHWGVASTVRHQMKLLHDVDLHSTAASGNKGQFVLGLTEVTAVLRTTTSANPRKKQRQTSSETA